MRTGRALIAALLLVAFAPATSSAPDRPLYYDRPITEADVAGRTLRELAIVRNTIFAHHGQPFRKQWLHQYFSKQPWYKPTSVVDPRTLSAVDQQNADFLSRYEISLPRAELERRLQPILDKHRYQTASLERQYAVSWSSDGKTVLFGNPSGVRAFDVASGKPAGGWVPDRRLGALLLVPGKLQAVVFDDSGRLRTVDLSQPKGAKVMSNTRLAGEWRRQVVLSPDGRRVLAGQAYDGEHDPSVVDPHVVVVDAASQRVLVTQSVGADEWVCLAFSGSERALVGTFHELTLWDLASGKPIWKRARGKGDSCAASPSGELVLADNLLLDGRSGAVERRLELGPFDRLNDVVAFSSSDGRVMVGGNGHHGRPYLGLWSTSDGHRIRTMDASAAVWAVAWSPDGKRALTFGAEGLAVWDVETGHRVSVLPGHVPWSDRNEAIEALLLSRALGRELPAMSGFDLERTPLDAPELLDELVPVATLDHMSRRDLRILRNMVYARRGRPFRSEILREYFERLDWYKADPAYIDARLTPVDRRNIKIIQSAEIKAGGPLTDRQHVEAEIPEA